MIDVEEFDKLYLKTTDSNIELVDDQFAVMYGSILAFEFSDAAVERLKSDKDITSIHIMPLMPKEIDPYYDTYGERLTDLIKHIIFHDQRCVDALMIVSGDSGLINTSKTVVEQNSRIITSTGNRFPTTESTIFDKGFDSFNAIIAENYNTSCWITCASSTKTDETIIDDEDDDCCDEIMSELYDKDIDDETMKGKHKHEVIIHTWEMNIKKTYTKQNGFFYSSMPLNSTSITAYYYEKGKLIPKLGDERNESL